VRPLAPSPAWMLVTPYCKRTRPGRGTNMKAAGFPPPSLAPAAFPSPLRAPSRADPSGLGHAATFSLVGPGTPPVSKRRHPCSTSLLPIKTVRGRLPHSVFCHSHSVLTAKPIPIPSCLSFSFPLSAKPIHISIPGYHMSFSFPLPQSLFPFPRASHAKLKLN
jgi:hypothetical protein